MKDGRRAGRLKEQARPQQRPQLNKQQQQREVASQHAMPTQSRMSRRSNLKRSQSGGEIELMMGRTPTRDELGDPPQRKGGSRIVERGKSLVKFRRKRGCTGSSPSPNSSSSSKASPTNINSSGGNSQNYANRISSHSSKDERQAMFLKIDRKSRSSGCEIDPSMLPSLRRSDEAKETKRGRDRVLRKDMLLESGDEEEGEDLTANVGGEMDLVEADGGSVSNRPVLLYMANPALNQTQRNVKTWRSYGFDVQLRSTLERAMKVSTDMLLCTAASACF